MGTRIYLDGKPVWANLNSYLEAQRAPRPSPVNTRRTRRGAPVKIDCTAAISPDPGSVVAQRFTAGVPFYDTKEQLTYRVVHSLNPLEGWAPIGLWRARWNLTHMEVIYLARDGLLDAVIEAGSQVRRYRCRDEYRVVTSEFMKKVTRARQVQVLNGTANPQRLLKKRKR